MDTYVYVPERRDHMREDRAAQWAVAHLLEDIGADLRYGLTRSRWTPRGAGRARPASPPPPLKHRRLPLRAYLPTLHTRDPL